LVDDYKKSVLAIIIVALVIIAAVGILGPDFLGFGDQEGKNDASYLDTGLMPAEFSALADKGVLPGGLLLVTKHKVKLLILNRWIFGT
jgi:hypothetical protein